MGSALRHVRAAAAIGLLAFGLGGSTGCATYSDKTASARAALTAGDYEGAVGEFNSFMKVNSKDKLPKKFKSSTVLAILERATVLHAMQDYENSKRDFELADKELEFLDIAHSAADDIGKFIYSDDVGRYQTSPAEKLNLNALNLLNYLATGDLEGARVEAKRFTTMRNYLKDYDPDNAHGAWGSYLAGFVFEKLGEHDSALRYYDEALQERELETLRGPIAKMGPTSSYRTERLDRYVGSSEAVPPGGGEILVVVMVGRVPYKVPVRLPIGAAVGIAGTYITGDPQVLARSALKVVTFPDLTPAENRFGTAAVQVDGRNVKTELVSNVGSEIVREFEDLKPKIIGAAITRLIARALVAEGVRAAGNAADSSGIAGLLGALAAEATLVALDKPDTRSWTTLPDRMFASRVYVPAGRHKVEVYVQGEGGREVRTLDVDVPDGGFVVVDVTTLR